MFPQVSTGGAVLAADAAFARVLPGRIAISISSNLQMSSDAWSRFICSALPQSLSHGNLAGGAEQYRPRLKLRK